MAGTLDPSDPADQWRMSAKLAGGGALYDIGIYSLRPRATSRARSRRKSTP